MRGPVVEKCVEVQGDREAFARSSMAEQLERVEAYCAPLRIDCLTTHHEPVAVPDHHHQSLLLLRLGLDNQIFKIFVIKVSSASGRSSRFKVLEASRIW